MSVNTTKKPSILIVETNPEVATVLKHWARDKYSATVCSSTEEGAEQIASDNQEFSVILTNWGKATNLGTDGEKIMVVAGKHCPGIPVIVMTGLNDFLEIYKYGPFYIIQKPLNLAMLESVVTNAIETEAVAA